MASWRWLYCIKTHNEYALTGDIIEEYPFYVDIVIPRFNKLFSSIIKKPIVLKQYASVGVCGIYIFNRKFTDYLQKYLNLKEGKKINACIPSLIVSDEQKISFLRGIFDTDGSIYFCKSNYKSKTPSFYQTHHCKPKIKLSLISEKLISEITQMLISLGFSPRNYRPSKKKEKENTVFHVVLDLNSDIDKWIKKIGFKNSKHITKVQVWKKFGFCPPYTKLNQRIKMIEGKLDPNSFYTL
jgi:intein/homing endonuclease